MRKILNDTHDWKNYAQAVIEEYIAHIKNVNST